MGHPYRLHPVTAFRCNGGCRHDRADVPKRTSLGPVIYQGRKPINDRRLVALEPVARRKPSTRKGAEGNRRLTQSRTETDGICKTEKVTCVCATAPHAEAS